jgi:hypothetical protein
MSERGGRSALSCFARFCYDDRGCCRGPSKLSKGRRERRVIPNECTPQAPSPQVLHGAQDPVSDGSSQALQGSEDRALVPLEGTPHPLRNRMIPESWLTIFSTPKAFQGDIGVIQRNAIQSWLRLRPECEIILLGDDDGTAEVASEFGLRHVSAVERNEFGTPLLNSVLQAAEKAASFRHLCYVNADIIILSDFLPAVAHIVSTIPRYLALGQRCDLDVLEPLNFSTNWEALVRSWMAERGNLLGHSGADYFVYPRGLWGEVPPFALGRGAWDNWLIYRAITQNASAVDLTPTTVVVHQNHGHSHVRAGEASFWKGPEAERNRALAGGYVRAYTLWDAQYRLTPKGVRRKLLPRFYRRFIALSACHRPFSWLLKLARILAAILRGERPGDVLE